MQRITFLTVGTPRTAWIREGIAEYTERISHVAKFETLSLLPSKENDSQRQREDESARILDTLEKKTGVVWVLDERGKQSTSEEFSAGLATLRDAGEEITFVLGGAYGMTDSVRSRADRVFALSAMTLPHELAALLFCEQLYRATQIMRGTGYHHAD